MVSLVIRTVRMAQNLDKSVGLNKCYASSREWSGNLLVVKINCEPLPSFELLSEYLQVEGVFQKFGNHWNIVLQFD